MCLNVCIKCMMVDIFLLDKTSVQVQGTIQNMASELIQVRTCPVYTSSNGNKKKQMYYLLIL